MNHLLQLNDEDRPLRFGTHTPDEVIRHYLEGLNFNGDAVFGVFNLDLKLMGMAHLDYLPEHNGEARAAEFGVSVLPRRAWPGLGHCTVTAPCGPLPQYSHRDALCSLSCKQ
ncbi:hypothetical protein [Polynucleobacter necessarius]|uniref:hypothetical protein n=1 Tax=Polynucleobacter necessarius TaxID=576610 RepID=UPI001E5D1D2A|nr:hypothetical protein [Polynucleobacter necessarius]